MNLCICSLRLFNKSVREGFLVAMSLNNFVTLYEKKALLEGFCSVSKLAMIPVQLSATLYEKRPHLSPDKRFFLRLFEVAGMLSRC
jgi:hypothetical protein